MRHFLFYMILLGYSNVTSLAQAQEKIILVTPADCQLLTNYIPSDDVEYKAGIDTRGNKVAPADLNSGNSLGLGQDGYSFYMTHDALKGNDYATDPRFSSSQEGKIILGQVTIKDGDVLWNGTSLKENEKKRIYMLCNEDNDEKRRPVYKR